MEKGHYPHIHDEKKILETSPFDRFPPIVTTADQFAGVKIAGDQKRLIRHCTFLSPHECLKPRDEVEILKSYYGFREPGHEKAQVQTTIVGDKSASASGADTSLITASGSGIGLIEQAVLNKGASASEKLKHMFLSKFPGFVGFKSVDLYSKTIVRDKGASASEGDTSLITGCEIGLIENRKPLVKEQNDNHTIDIPAQEDSPQGRFPYEERHKVGIIAVLCIAASAQTLLSLVGGSGAMRLQ